MESLYNVDSGAFAEGDMGEIRRQISWLVREVSRELVHLKSLKAQYSQEEKQLASFMDHYLSQVGDCLVGLAVGGSARIAWRPFARTPVEAETVSPYAEKSIQQIYRKLVKVLHPDMHDGGSALARQFHLLQQAYENRDVETLTQLEVMLGEDESVKSESEVQQLERLEQRYQAILNEKDRLLVRQHAMKNSPEWELMQRVQSWGSRSGEVVNKIRSAMLAERELSLA